MENRGVTNVQFSKREVTTTFVVADDSQPRITSHIYRCSHSANSSFRTCLSSSASDSSSAAALSRISLCSSSLISAPMYFVSLSLVLAESVDMA